MDAPMRSPPSAPILIVEDENDIRTALRFLFEDEGFEVAEAATTVDALAYLRTTTSPHVVLLDFLIPPTNAETLLQAIEADVSLQRHRYVLMPASQITQFSQHAQRLITVYCSEIVYKPFDLEDMLAAAKQAAGQLSASAPNL